MGILLLVNFDTPKQDIVDHFSRVLATRNWANHNRYQVKSNLDRVNWRGILYQSAARVARQALQADGINDESDQVVSAEGLFEHASTFVHAGATTHDECNGETLDDGGEDRRFDGEAGPFTLEEFVRFY